MAQCFRARDHETGDVVFLKRVRIGSAHEGSLRRELDIYTNLIGASCENVLEILGQERDEHYVALVTEFADGGDWRAMWSQTARQLSPAVAIGVACDVARGSSSCTARDRSS